MTKHFNRIDGDRRESTHQWKDGKTEIVARLIAAHKHHPVAKLLVVGCGSGIEAAVLAESLNTEVIGIDLADNFAPEATRAVDLRVGNAMALGFEDASFQFVYSYHALEHIADPRVALKEIRRVLMPGGGYWIGTPNRRRVLGYVGSPEVPLREKVAWNLNDWKARLSGRFKNELGAHAGFSARELSNLLRAEFSTVNDMSRLYYREMYPRYRVALKLADVSTLSEILYPSVYFMGTR
jgi:ubiquinone/menaquinone biosynthesis C-methylase UbiE